MRVELKRLQRELHHTIVYVTHDQEEAMSIADRIAVMEAGEIRQVGTPAEIYNLPNSRYVAELIGAPPMNFVDGALVDGGRFEGRDVPLAVTLEGAEGRGPAALAVRPEDLEIDTSGAVAKGGVEASIYEVEPLGAFTIVDVSAGEQILKVAGAGPASVHPRRAGEPRPRSRPLPPLPRRKRRPHPIRTIRNARALPAASTPR